MIARDSNAHVAVKGKATRLGKQQVLQNAARRNPNRSATVGCLAIKSKILSAKLPETVIYMIYIYIDRYVSVGNGRLPLTFPQIVLVAQALVSESLRAGQ